jgi:hypothetical protein
MKLSYLISISLGLNGRLNPRALKENDSHKLELAGAAEDHDLTHLR